MGRAQGQGHAGGRLSSCSLFSKIIYLFFYVWLCWVFDAARELSVVERSRADSLAVVLCWVFDAARELSVVERSRADSLAVVLLLLRAKGSRGGLSGCRAWAGLSCLAVATFRETNSLRKTMQMMECGLLHRWARGRVSS